SDYRRASRFWRRQHAAGLQRLLLEDGALSFGYAKTQELRRTYTQNIYAAGRGVWSFVPLFF
ncbi:MAG: hypothetical protein K2N81_04285, partial [Acetatifactor sp.]|nr:hypothetical protein [Acetatifactor sp.]